MAWLSDEALQRHSLGLTLGVALFSTVLLCIGPVTTGAIPSGDGYAYARRAVELHGLLHAGNWAGFLDALRQPATSIFSPAYLFFLALPTGLAGGPAYGFLTCLLWNLLLAGGVFGIASELGVKAFAPAVLLMLTANNLALDGSYFFHMDLTFLAWGTVCLWLQLRAWRRNLLRHAVILGAALSGLIFLKPANSLVVIPLFFAAECLRCLHRAFRTGKAPKLPLAAEWARHTGGVLAGLLPGALASLAFGSFQTIVMVIVANEQSGYFATTTPAHPLFRLVYFPLCLSYFYSLGFLVIPLGILCVLGPPGERRASSSRDDYLVPWTLSYLVIWGLFFAWISEAKIVRSLVLMLPVLAFVLLGTSLGKRVRAGLVAACAGFYFLLVHLQAFTGIFETTPPFPENYALDLDWKWAWSMPAGKDLSREPFLTTSAVLGHLRQAGITEGNIGVGSPAGPVAANTLNWAAQSSDLLAGRKPALRFATLIDDDGLPNREGLEGVQALLLVLDPALQFSNTSHQFNLKMAQHAMARWQPEHASIAGVGKGPQQLELMIVRFNQPLRGKLLEDCMASLAPRGYSPFYDRMAAFEGRRLSLTECWRLLHGEAPSRSATAK